MSSLSAPAASSILLHAYALLVLTTRTLLLVAATASSSVPVDDVNTTTTMLTTNGSVTTTTTSPIMSAAAAAAAAAAASEKWEMYYCFLCTGRHPLLIHRCPIYWDECHINCWDAIPDDPSSSAPPAPPVGSSSSAPAPGKDCYVMKLYNSGRYVIVQHLNCDYVATYACFLTCGGGELVADHQKAAGAMATTTTVQQGSLLPFELCNTQLLVNALRAPPSAGVDVVTAAHGGAH